MTIRDMYETKDVEGLRKADTLLREIRTKDIKQKYLIIKIGLVAIAIMYSSLVLSATYFIKW